MRCPVCGQEMEEGGLIINGGVAGLVPLEEFNKKGVKRLAYTGYRTIGKHNFVLNQTKVSNAHFCKNCNKIVGVFDITNRLED